MEEIEFVDVDPDTLDSRCIDAVAYWEASAFEILDDEIDWLDRDGRPLASPIAASVGYFECFQEDD